MALHSLTEQDILDSRYEKTAYSGERAGDRDAGVSYIEDYQRASRRFEGVERHNAATDEPDSTADHRSSSNQKGRDDPIDDLVRSWEVRAARKTPVNSGVRSLTPIMEWEGSVESIEGDGFVARLCNVTTGEILPTEEARFPVSDLNDVQRGNLEKGAIFRWVIGLQRLPNGNKQRVSELFFRRLPAHSRREMDETLERIGAWLDAREWDDTPSR